MKTKTTIESITPEQFHTMTRAFIGLPVSHTWRGYGDAIFFELGQLLPRSRTRKDGSIRTSYRGQATIDLENGWRVERLRSIFFGSSNGYKRIENCLKKLEGLEIVEITSQGRLPEVIIQLSGGYWLHSFATWEGQPDWTLFFNENGDSTKWLMAKNGKIVLATESAKA
ncbi:MAG TPA: hypothetical protein VGB45_11220 [Abditibacterium sp.]|jgi:hypothetical protein